MPFDRGHALLIGVGSYPSAPYRPVPTIERDVDALGALLVDPAACGYPPGQVTVLKGAAATREAVLHALDGLAALPPEATVTIYFTGHGERSADHAYHLVTHDAQWQNGKVQDGTALREAELIARLRAVRAERLLLIVNACSSGALSPVLGAGQGEEDGEALLGEPLPPAAADAALATGKGRIIITATRESQVSFVGAGELTPFAQALLDGLRGKTTYPRNGLISAFDLYAAVYDGVAALLPKLVSAATLQRYGGAQEPELTVLKGVGSYAVALYRGAQVQSLGDISEGPPADLAVREVSERQSRRALDALLSSVAGRDAAATQAGRDAATAQGEGIAQVGNQGPTNAHRGGGLNFGSGNQFGDLSFGDIAGRDVIRTTYGQGTVVNPTGPVSQNFGNQRNINAGIYQEGGTAQVGDNISISNVSGSILNVKSTLTNVTQSIGEIKGGSQGQREELRALVEQLRQALEKVPPERADEAEAVAAMTEQAVEQVKKEQPNKVLTKSFADNIVAAAKNLAGVADDVITVATKVAAAILAFL